MTPQPHRQGPSLSQKAATAADLETRAMDRASEPDTYTGHLENHFGYCQIHIDAKISEGLPMAALGAEPELEAGPWT